MRSFPGYTGALIGVYVYCFLDIWATSCAFISSACIVLIPVLCPLRRCYTGAFLLPRSRCSFELELLCSFTAVARVPPRTCLPYEPCRNCLLFTFQIPVLFFFFFHIVHSLDEYRLHTIQQHRYYIEVHSSNSFFFIFYFNMPSFASRLSLFLFAFFGFVLGFVFGSSFWAFGR